MTAQPVVITKFGEITNKPMYQVRGDPQWHSTPAKAVQVHKKLQQAYESGFFRQGKR